MALFTIPAGAFVGVTAVSGERTPASGLYECAITKIGPSPGGKPGNFSLTLTFPTGFTLFDNLSVNHDPNGQPLTLADPSKAPGRLRGVRAVLESIGYTAENIEKYAFTDAQFMGAKVRVRYLAPAPGASGFGDIDAYLTEAAFTKEKAEGRAYGNAEAQGGGVGVAPMAGAPGGAPPPPPANGAYNPVAPPMPAPGGGNYVPPVAQPGGFPAQPGGFGQPPQPGAYNPAAPPPPPAGTAFALPPRP